MGSIRTWVGWGRGQSWALGRPKRGPWDTRGCHGDTVGCGQGGSGRYGTQQSPAMGLQSDRDVLRWNRGRGESTGMGLRDTGRCGDTAGWGHGHGGMGTQRGGAGRAGMGPRPTFSFLRALNFFRHSTVSCLCIMEATVERCCGDSGVSRERVPWGWRGMGGGQHLRRPTGV